MKTNKKLSNKRHQAFCDEYLINGMNATQAYLTVYKSVNKKITAEVNGSKLLSNTKVKAYIEERQAVASEKSELTQQIIVNRQNRRSQIVDQMLELSIKDNLTPQETSKLARLMMVIKTSDANASDKILNEMLGYNKPKEISIKTEFDVGIPGLNIDEHEADTED